MNTLRFLSGSAGAVLLATLAGVTPARAQDAGNWYTSFPTRYTSRGLVTPYYRGDPSHFGVNYYGPDYSRWTDTPRDRYNRLRQNPFPAKRMEEPLNTAQYDNAFFVVSDGYLPPRYRDRIAGPLPPANGVPDVMRTWPTTARLRGTIRRTRTLAVPGTAADVLTALLETDTGRDVVVDLGPVEHLDNNDARVSRGNRVTVRGQFARAGDQSVLMAYELDISGARVPINRLRSPSPERIVKAQAVLSGVEVPATLRTEQPEQDQGATLRTPQSRLP